MKYILYKLFKNKKPFSYKKILGGMMFGITLEKHNSPSRINKDTILVVYLGSKYYLVGWNNF